MKNKLTAEKELTELLETFDKKALAKKLDITVRRIDQLLNGWPVGKHLYRYIKDLHANRDFFKTL